MIGLKPEMIYRVRTTHASEPTEQSAKFKESAEADRPTEWDDQYMRLAIQFVTGIARYAFLNTSLFLAAGRLLGTGHIEYAVYRVT